jgi:hypothetical protein
MHRMAHLLVLALLPLTACGSDTSESSAPTACLPRTVTYESTTDGSLPMTPLLPDDEEGVAAAIADSFCSPEWKYVRPDGPEQTVRARTTLPVEDATCMGEQLVGVLGADRANELELGTGPWSVLFLGLLNNQPPPPRPGTTSPDNGERQIDRAEAESIVDVLVDCSDHWKLLLILSVTEGADTISDSSAGCVADRLSDDEAKSMLISEIDRAYDDPAQPDAQPFPESIEPLLAAYDECLTPAELNSVDF